MAELARQQEQARLTSQHTLCARRLYEAIQKVLTTRNYAASRAHIVGLFDEAAAAAAALAPIDAAQREASAQRLTAARAQAAAEQAEISRQQAEAKAVARARDRAELAAIRHREEL